MILGLNGQRLSIKVPKTIPVDWMQVLLDSEVFFAGKGIAVQIRCIPCLKSGDAEGAYCVASSDDSGHSFSVECGCTLRTSMGEFTVPATPEIPTERALLEPKREEPLSRLDLDRIDTFERILKLLDLQYLMRCMRCQMADRRDGIIGSRETSSTFYVAECECCRRVYRGPDVRWVH